MLKETLISALKAVRLKIVTADKAASSWLAERDRRRRQEAAFLRGIVRLVGSQRKAALIVGLGQATISRTLDPEGHAKLRAADTARRNDPSSEKLGSLPPEPDQEPASDNVVNLWRLRDLYEHDKSTLVSLGFRKTVSAAESALNRCSRLEQAYFICEIIPEFKKDLEAWLARRNQNDIARFRYTDEMEAPVAEENHTSHEHG